MDQKKLCRYVLCLGMILLLVSELRAQTVLFPDPLSPRIANYDIEVTLDTEKGILHGREVLTWQNQSVGAINELQFHLYLNAFRNSKSTFMKENSGRWRIEKDGWGFIEVDRIALSDREDLTDRIEFIHPDDGNEDDRTVFRLNLLRGVPPGGTIVLNIDFTAKLPSPPLERVGAKEEYFFVAHWFPKIGVYIDGKWNCHQFHANSEFFPTLVFTTCT